MAKELRVTTFARNRTVEALVGKKWGAPSYDSHVVRRTHELVKKRVDELSVEDLRLLIGQKIALPYLVPVAIEQLERDPLVQGDFYPGDLLASVLQVTPMFWEVNPPFRERLVVALAALESVPAVLREQIAAFTAS